VIIFFAGLIYAVYFTELGKPEVSESEKSTTTYGQTAVPTIFVQWSPVPIIELDWVFADQDLLKFAILIHDLAPNVDPVDWICNPQVTIDKPVPHRLLGYEMTPSNDASGASVRATYEYEINVADHDALTVDMDITIGPCADYLNFAETNDLPADYPVYRYMIENVDINTVQDFYENKMQTAGWELLGIADTSAAKTGKGYSLWFAKDQDVVTISVFMKENTTHVLIHLE
jgi:hypothetical protein